MARYATYPSPNASPITRKWLIRGFLLSLLIHLGLFIFAYLKKLDNFGFSDTSRPIPSKFVVNKVTIDPKLLEPMETGKKVDIKTSTPPIELPPEKPMIKEIEIKPSAPDTPSPLLDERPKPTPINVDNLVKTDAISAGDADNQISALVSALLKDGPISPNQPRMRLRNGTPDGDTADNGGNGIPGQQTIDDALNKIGAANPGDKVAIRGGALFDYDKADLRPDAVDDMEKLGKLMLLNPRATFRIEGHTDSKGGRDYNLDLSQRRADAVKAWLVERLKIDPARITTLGFANDRPLVSPDKSIDEQQPNRRVEIVILTNPAN